MTSAARIQRVVSCPMGKEVTVTPLRTRMIEEMTARGLAPRTVESYVRFVAQLATHFHRSPADLTDEQVRRYIASMSLERHLSASTVNVAVNAFRFFYHVVIGRKPVEFDIPRGRKQHRLPHVLSREEVQRLFAIPQNRKHQLMMLTAYATGVRVNELVHLRVSDIDSQRMTVRVEQGKGSRDRYTILSPLLLEALREYWRAERPKTWLFPSREGDHPPDVTGIQRVFKLTKERARITKPGGIHLLRHSFATHLLEQGVDVHRIQMLMGHRGLGTTAIYLHVTQREATQVGSPLELLDLPPTKRG